MQVSDFETFPTFRKIPRWYKEWIITEKIDGTNGLIAVFEDGTVRAGSRNRWLDPDDPKRDNYGFGGYVKYHEDEFRNLGVGLHYGEWWGVGIARNYGLTERRWSPFNTFRWNAESIAAAGLPANVYPIPVLWQEEGSPHVQMTLDFLGTTGSAAARGYMNPEGVVVYHVPSGNYFKAPFDKEPKGK